MTNKTAHRFHIIGKILLGMIIVFDFLGGLILMGLCGFSGTDEMFNSCLKQTGLFVGMIILLPLIAFFIVRIYSIVIGVIELVIGVVLAILIIFPMNDFRYAPIFVAVLIDGALFLASGLINRKDNKSQVET